MRLLSTLLFLLIFSSFGFCQESPSKNAKAKFEFLPFSSVNIKDNTPDWAKIMYSSDPNFHDVEFLFKQWRKLNPNIKDEHTRNFKHLYNYIVSNNGLTQDGRLKPNLENEIALRNEVWANSRVNILRNENTSKRSNNNTDWVSLGPNMMFRNGSESNIQANIYAISQSLSNPNVVYASSEAGGAVFRSDNKGDTWNSTSDDYSFDGPRELEVDPGNPDSVYISSYSNIYRSINGGNSWASIYYNWSSQINAIIIDPNDPKIILASGKERIIKTIDGGLNWTEVYTGRTYDIKFKPGNTNIVYALMDNPTSLQTDFYKSLDVGSTWNKINSGWPNETSTGNKGGRITVSDGFPDIIYAFIGAEYTGAPTPKDGIKILKSINSGSDWTTLIDYNNANGVNNGQGYYDWDIEVSDTDPDIVVFGTQGRWLTTDGFATNNWTKTGGDLGHADMQEALINGSDIWIANDGGIIKFTDEKFDHFDIKMQGINATSFWSFDQGWNRDAQVGSHYHNGTSARTDSYSNGDFLSYGGAEPQFSALKHPYPDKAWSKGYGAVNGKSLPDNINTEIESFNYNITPNAEYGSSTWKESEIEVYPKAYNTHFTGVENVLYRSDDFGLSWDLVHSFGTLDTRLTKIEIPRSNTDIIYATTYDPAGFSLYKSEDLGNSFTTINGPSSLSSDGVFIAVDQNNEEKLWIASRHGGSDNNKIFKTLDGGTSWTNLSTDVLDNHSIRAIMSVGGTDGGIYLVASNAVFYRNNTLPDWQILINNLPQKVSLRDIKPYYKEGKLRVAGDARGVWGAEFYDSPTTIIPQATVNYVDSPCSRDTLYFDDFSIVNHSGATWFWEFSPSPSFIDNPNVRNPKVVFGGSGNYQATMNLVKGGITYKDTLELEIMQKCNVEYLVGNSYEISEYGKHVTINDIDQTLDAFTYSMWVRPNETQTATAFFVSKDIDNAGINYYGSTKNVTIHYPGYSTWSYNTGMEAPANRWTHLALTSDKNTGDIILYVNGVPYNYTDANSNYVAKSISFNKIILGWQHNWWGSRWFNGEIEEFCLYNKALSQGEIRLQMHHIQDAQSNANLIHYFQFNEENGSGVSFDKIGNRHAETPGKKVLSRGPIGPGSTQIKIIDSEGEYDYADQNLKMTLLNGIYPDGEISVSKIERNPDQNPVNKPSNSSYWIIHNYGINKSFTGVIEIQLGDINILGSPFSESDFSLYKRDSNQDGATWNFLDQADITDSNSKEIVFNTGLSLNSFSQFAIINGNAKGWVGTTSVDWNNPLNWGEGVVPDLNDNVIIPPFTPFQPEVNNIITIKTLILLQDAILKVKSSGAFSVKN